MDFGAKKYSEERNIMQGNSPLQNFKYFGKTKLQLQKKNEQEETKIPCY